METQKLGVLWDQQSQKYLDRAATLEAWPFEASFLPQKGDKILDAGCGAGTYLGMFAPLSEARYGVDISEAMAKAASRHGKAQQGDVRALPFTENTFDYVLSVLVISHCGDPTKGFAELSRVCRPGGHVVLVLPSVFSLNCLIRNITIALGKYSLGTCQHDSPRSVRKLCQQFNMELVDQQTWNRRPECDTFFRQFVGEVGYWTDQALRLLFPVWGDCLVFKLKKRPPSSS